MHRVNSSFAIGPNNNELSVSNVAGGDNVRTNLTMILLLLLTLDSGAFAQSEYSQGPPHPTIATRTQLTYTVQTEKSAPEKRSVTFHFEVAVAGIMDPIKSRGFAWVYYRYRGEGRIACGAKLDNGQGVCTWIPEIGGLPNTVVGQFLGSYKYIPSQSMPVRVQPETDSQQ